MIGPSRRMVVLAVAGAVAIAPVISGCGAGEEPQSAAPTQLTDGVNVSVPKDDREATQIALRNMFLLGPKAGQPVAAGSSLPLYGVVINQVKGRQDRLVAVSSPLFGSAKIDGSGLTLPPAAQDGTGSVVKLLGKASATPPAKPTKPAQQTGRPSPGASGTPSQEPTGAGTTPEPNSSPTAGGTAPSTPKPEQVAPPTTPGGEQPLVVLTGLQQELRASSRVPVRMQFEKAGTVEFQVPVIAQQGEYDVYPAVVPVDQPPASPTPGGSQPPASGEPTSSGAPEQPGSTESPSGTPPSGH